MPWAERVWAAGGSASVRQFRQIVRTRRCPVTAASDPANCCGGTPRSWNATRPWAALWAVSVATTSRLEATRIAATAVPWSGTAESMSTSGRTAITECRVSSIRGPPGPASTSTCRDPSRTQWMGDSRDSTSRWDWTR